ncbi:OPT oligopeptide transporter protein-domain-containing protein [Boletus coccyginus]|nr:OPT oligopeptide transporter protein-domain-containing protein [Boletus coccyginus]
MSPSDHVSGPQDHPSQLFDIQFNGGLAEARAIADQDKDSDSSHHVRAFNSASLDDDSPYPEVRSAVANTDDPSIPTMTLRTWALGLILAVLMAGINQFLFFRYPSVPVGATTAQLVSFPLGKLWASYVPRKRIFGISLNPGPFSIKEHVLITIMASVGALPAYATDIIAVQRVYYNQYYSLSYQWFLTGGIARRFLVSPANMIWPTTLVTCALFNTLHSQQYAGCNLLGGMSRERFFLYASTGSFVWYFFPGYLFQALSYFSWVTWIWPENAVIAQLFGYVHGMGMSVITFDWSQIAYTGSPLATPWWAAVNILIGFVVFFWIVTPILYFTNTWMSLYMPILSRHVFDNTMQPYNVTRILTPDLTLNMEAYESYSPLYMSYVLLFFFLLILQPLHLNIIRTAVLVHTLLHFRTQIMQQMRRSLQEEPDIHGHLMSLYPQVPEWWYLVLFVIVFILGILTIEWWHTQMPVWAFVFALLISYTFVVPCGMIQAVTNQRVGLNVITELVIGYLLPGHLIATMFFKMFGYVTMQQALIFTADFKLGHYMKIPPRTMFWCQIICTAVAGTTQLLMQSWMFDHIPEICSNTQKDGFICPNTQVFATASVIWGVVGPKLQFSPALLYFFIAGAIAPIVPWLLMKKWPNSFLRYINPIIFNGTDRIPPATALNFVPWAFVSFAFQFVIRRRYFLWWAKYNYVLSAALDSGLALSAITIFFTLQYPQSNPVTKAIEKWWGNQVFRTNYDALGIPVRQLAPGDTFG